MKAIQLNDDFIAFKKSFIKKTAATLAVSALVVTLTIYYFFVPVRTSFTLIAGVASILCLSKLLFCFVKPSSLLYKIVAAVVSLFCGCHFYYILNTHSSHHVFAVPRFVSDFAAENPDSAWILIVIGIYLIYAAMIFGMSMLVQFIYKKIKKMMMSSLR